MNYKKFLATAATATLVASAIVPVVSASSFKDVKEDDSHKEAIEALVELEIVNGYPDNTFKPYNELTRGNVVKMLGRWVVEQGFEIPSNWKTEQRFKDLPVDFADQELVMYAAVVKDAKVFNGSNGNLMHTGKMTRQNMALTLDRAYKGIFGISLVELAENADQQQVQDLSDAREETQDEIQALRNLGISNVDNFLPNNTVTRGQFASFLYRTINVEKLEEVVEGLQVLSVQAVNSSTIEVQFSEAIDADPENIDNVKVQPKGNATSPDSVTYELSEDGKTLSISTNIKNNEFFKGNYNVVIDFESVKGAKENEYVPAFNQTVNFSDNAAPTFTTEQVSALVYKVKFSEPVRANSFNNMTFVDKDGKAVNVTTSLNEEQTVLTIAMPQNDAEFAAGEEVNVTIVGVKDIAGNLVSPNPIEFTMTKGEKDGVAPTVEKVQQSGAKSFTVQVSEELVEVPSVEYGTEEPLSAVKSVEVDENDPTLFHVTVNEVLETDAYYVKVSNLTDLSGEVEEEVTKIVSFTKDTVAPKAVSYEVVKDETNKEMLEITFDKNVVVAEDATVTAAGKAVKNGVTTQVNGQAASVTQDAHDAKVVRVELNELLAGENLDIEGAKYNVKLTVDGITSESEEAVKPFDVEFTRGNDTAEEIETPIEVVSVTQGNANNIVVVEFSKDVDGQSATNEANYQIANAKVIDATVKAGELNKVYLTLEDDSNTFTGVRNATISGVKAKDSDLVMEEVTIVTGDLVENVAPVVTSAKLNIESKELEIKFSEDIKLLNLAEVVNDFEVLVDGESKETALKIDVNEASENKTKATTITVTVDLEAEDMHDDKTITLVGLEDSDITDMNGNKVKFTAPITVSK